MVLRTGVGLVQSAKGGAEKKGRVRGLPQTAVFQAQPSFFFYSLPAGPPCAIPSGVGIPQVSTAVSLPLKHIFFLFPLQ